MGKLFFGSQTGTTNGVADSIKAALDDLIEETKCIQFAKPNELAECNFLVLGGSTWGDGELTDDWQDFWHHMDKIDFKGKTVALFGLGDQYSYSYNFVSSMKTLYDKVVSRGATVICSDVSTEGFDFDHSEAVVDGKFVGLAIDEVNEPELTQSRIDSWAARVRESLLAATV